MINKYRGFCTRDTPTITTTYVMYMAYLHLNNTSHQQIIYHPYRIKVVKILMHRGEEKENPVSNLFVSPELDSIKLINDSVIKF